LNKKVESLADLLMEQKRSDMAFGLAYENIPPTPLGYLRTLVRKRVKIRNVSIVDDAHWIILYNEYGFWSQGVPQAMTDFINQSSKAGWTFKSVSLGNFGSWAAICGDYSYSTWGLDASAVQNLAAIFSAKKPINCFAQGQNAEWALVFQGNAYISSNCTANLVAELKDFNSKGQAISSISMLGSNFCILGPTYYGAAGPQTLLDALKKFNSQGRSFRCVSFAPNNGWLFVGSRLSR
jgi:hypothetical protein